MEILKERYTITELSECLHVTDHTLRYYEKEFSLKVPKDERGRRYYTTDMANIMYQIKTMRDEGLEIKAIRKILQSENIIAEPAPMVYEEVSASLVPLEVRDNPTKDMKAFFIEFKDQITNSVSAEVSSAREQISKEINKSKLELGACFENNFRRFETKMEKHFQEVDLSLGKWREKNKSGIMKRLFRKAFGQ